MMAMITSSSMSVKPQRRLTESDEFSHRGATAV
jgi:hypothetical protein